MQFSYGHVEHLKARVESLPFSDDARAQIFAQSMCESFLETLFDLYEGLRDQKEHGLCIFAFLSEVFKMSGDGLKQSLFTRFVELTIRLVGEVSRPSFFSDEVNKEYFSQLTNTIQKSPKLFASEAGTEYLAVFSCSSGALLGTTGQKQHFER